MSAAVAPTHRLDPAVAASFARDSLVAAGMSADDAGVVSDILVEGSLRGVDSHGLVRLAQYVANLTDGTVKSRPSMTWPTENGGIAVLDADNGMGHVAATVAMSRAVDLAGELGVAFVGVRNSSHFGPAAAYSLLAARRNCIGIVWTNAPAVMPPTGGREARLSNNPLSIGVPVAGGEPLVLDIAMSVAAGGKIRLAFLAGDDIPPDWALTKDGEPTTDPREATEGLLLPLGGHKGYGMAFMADVLSGVLTGSAFGADVGWQGVSVAALDRTDRVQDGRPLGIGHACLALRVDAFMALASFDQRLSEFVAQMQNCPRRRNVDQIFVPGEIENAVAARRRAEGIPASDDLLGQLVRAAEGVGVTAPDELILNGGQTTDTK
jgi:LDH2 family malate/lactate/ureidoglycolate dehydrogenase